MKPLNLLRLLLIAVLLPTISMRASELDRIAEVYLAGDARKALTQLEAYLKKRPKDAQAWTIKGNILEDLDENEEAEKAFKEALKVNPKTFEAICSLGILYRKRGDYDGAVGYYQKALEINPDYAQAYSSMAVIELKRRRDAEALRLAQLAYLKDKEDPVIAANLAITYHYNGKERERDKYTRIAKELGYKNMENLRKFYTGELTIRDD